MGLFWVGVSVAVTGIVLLMRSRLIAVIAGHSLRYDRSGHATGWLGALVLLAYIAPTILPLFVSTAPLARVIGVVLTMSLVLTALIERNA